MEKDRGISITSAVLKFDYERARAQTCSNTARPRRLLPRTPTGCLKRLTCAIMLLDSAKGLEAADAEAFRTCAGRGTLPVCDVREQVGPAGAGSRWNLLDEIEQRIGLRPTPLNWPVGIAGDFRGLIERSTGEYTAYTRRPGGAERALEEVFKDQEKSARA